MPNNNILSKLFNLSQQLHSVDTFPQIMDVSYDEICEELHIARIEFNINTVFNICNLEFSRKDFVLYDCKEPSRYGRCISRFYKCDYDGDITGKIFLDNAFSDVSEECESVCCIILDLINLKAITKKYYQIISYLVSHDQQTQLPNLQSFRDTYETTARHTDINDFSVLFINLQNFKYINRKGGSVCGDAGIVKYAHILDSFIDKSQSESVARLGGDNFVALIRNHNIESFLQKISNVELTDLPVTGNYVFHIAAWCGIDNSDNPLGVKIEHAATALQLARNVLNKTVVYYTEELYQMTLWSKMVVGSFSSSLNNGEFKAYFQPKVRIQDGSIVGLEALVRWYHKGQLVFPDRFIPILEHNDLIYMLDLEILRQSCKAIREWLDLGLTPPRISVNISRQDLFVDNIEEKILSIIKDSGISTEYIEIEITENANMNEFPRMCNFLSTLKNNGIMISIDDFGTGYSSLALIKNINADILKIDKSFVDDCQHNDRSYLLITNIINLAKELDMDIIAEGVETVEQAQFLNGIGCFLAQGYLYDKPITYEEITARLMEGGYSPL